MARSGIRTNRLLCAHLPGGWGAATVHDRHDQDRFRLDSEVDSEGKASKEGAPNNSIHVGVSQRISPDPADRFARLKERLAAQAKALYLVPGCSIVEVILRFLSQENTMGHSALRILSITASVSSPSSPSISKARSRKSSSRL